MKKILVLLLCLTLFLSLGISVSAAGTTAVQFEAESSEVNPGDKLTIEVYVSSSDVCTSLGLALEYDSSVFEVVKGKCGLKGAALSIFDEGRGFAYLYPDGITPDGTLGTVTMKIKENAPAGVYEVTGRFAASDDDDNKLTATVTGTSIAVAGGSAKQETVSADPTQSLQQEQTVQTDAAPTPQEENDVVAMPETAEKPTLQADDPAQENAAVDTKTDAEVQENGGYALLVELGIAVVVLVALCAALVVCLIRFSKRKLNK